MARRRRWPAVERSNWYVMVLLFGFWPVWPFALECFTVGGTQQLRLTFSG